MTLSQITAITVFSISTILSLSQEAKAGAFFCNELLTPKTLVEHIQTADYSRAFAHIQNGNWSKAWRILTTPSRPTPLIDPIELGNLLATPGIYFSPYDGPLYANAIAHTVAARQNRGIDVSMDISDWSGLPALQTQTEAEMAARFPNREPLQEAAELERKSLNQAFAQLTPSTNPFPVVELNLTREAIPFSGGRSTKVFTADISRTDYQNLFGRLVWTNPRTQNPSIIIRYLQHSSPYNTNRQAQAKAVRKTLAAGLLHEHLGTQAAPISRWVVINGKLAVVSEYIHGRQAIESPGTDNLLFSPAAALGEYLIGNGDNHITNFQLAQNQLGTEHLIFYDHDFAFESGLLSLRLINTHAYGRALPPITTWPEHVVNAIKSLNENVISGLVGRLLTPSELQGLYLRAEVLQTYLRLSGR